MNKCLKIFTQVISNYLRKKAGYTQSEVQAGGVTLIQRFGGGLNVNIHFHSLFLDGIYKRSEKPKFIPTYQPKDIEVDEILSLISSRVLKYLTNSGFLTCDEYFEADANNLNLFDQCQSASSIYRIAFGPRKGQKVLEIKSVKEPNGIKNKPALCSKLDGFSLHAGVSCKKIERKKLERICGYITRPPLAQDRIAIDKLNGDIIYKLKTAYSNGVTHLKFTPNEFLEKLAGLVPRPRVNLTRFHGCLAPNAVMRSKIIPKQDVVEEKIEEAAGTRKHKKSWAMLLKRVFNLDMEKCFSCGGKIKVISAIKDPLVIREILRHLGLDPQAPEASPSRGPPSKVDEYIQYAPDYDNELE